MSVNGIGVDCYSTNGQNLHIDRRVLIFPVTSYEYCNF